ncbi:uncharacterized protein LOC130688394 [Daphnia carinata]|uniref:uncharacterized protein LOC130688394 n=1 Tax=Daphnia carinata TaxID=120202 RepID=UPI00257CBE17|nr:uncharacterized protein LOC130688394 [Daphnia carinata]
MRISLRALSLRGRWMHWNSWKGWLYLTIFVFISGRLLLSHGITITLTPSLDKTDSIIDVNANSIGPKTQHGDRGLKMAVTASTWPSSPFAGSVPKSQEDGISNQLHVSDGSPSSFSVPEENRNQGNWITAGTSKEIITNDENNEPNQPIQEEVNYASLESERERRYWLRSERIRQVCRSRGVVSYPTVYATVRNETRPVRSPNSVNQPVSMYEEFPVTSHFALAPTFQTMGCFLNKVASSSLVSAFLLVHGFGPTFTSPHSLTFNLLPRSIADFEFANQTYFKFMFVRHPMDRMLSCYLDKMVESPHFSLPAFRSYVKHKARLIMGKRRKLQPSSRPHYKPRVRKLLSAHGDTLSSNRADSQIIYGHQVGNDKTTFEADETETQKLHRYVGQRRRHGPVDTSDQIANVANPAAKNTSGVKPTFEEFLEFVLDTDLLGIGYDAHWVPFHRHCSPCSVPYHVIGKLETGADDFQYIWDKTGLGTQVPVPWINRNTAPSKAKIELEKKHYSSLPRELIMRFYDAFRMDFELFDYSINDILLKAGYETV